MSTVALVCVVLALVTVVFLGCCLLLRIVYRSMASDEIKHTNTLPCENVVIHSKRVYEIQAEEGCFTSLPNIHEAIMEQQRFGSNEELSFTDGVEYSPRSPLKRPETGDLKSIRHEHNCEEFKHMAKRKARKVHKDSMCALLFRSEPNINVEPIHR